ncbi:MAG: (2Fe-2S) ferredoxin domain-containing protein [Oscillospiraceae bacterium]|nr:(2Fe-2S) ferredoxin domain-containing protein [Oscillospiraceae bacterium]
MQIKSLEELKAVREKVSAKVSPRRGSGEPRVLVGMGTCGISSGAREVMGEIVGRLSGAGEGSGKAVPVGCIGMCGLEPLIAVVMPGEEPVAYGNVDKEKAAQIVDSHVLGGKIIDEYTAGADIAWRFQWR